MKFTYFTLGGCIFWEDIYNYQGWIIQHNVRTSKYRLLDNHNICRTSGSFEQCKDTLLKYIEAYELETMYNDTVLILHGFGKSKRSVSALSDALKDLQMNIIPITYPSLLRGVKYHANMLAKLIENLDIKGKLYIINVGTSCLITRQLIHNSNNYRNYNIARVLDINPLNSGSDLAELLSKKSFFNFILGPMLKDISTPEATKFAKLPKDIEHGIIFSPTTFHNNIKKLLSRFESIAFSTPPSERSYAEKIKDLNNSGYFIFKNKEVIKECKNFITTGDFSDKS